MVTFKSVKDSDKVWKWGINFTGSKARRAQRIIDSYMDGNRYVIWTRLIERDPTSLVQVLRKSHIEIIQFAHKKKHKFFPEKVDLVKNSWVILAFLMTIMHVKRSKFQYISCKEVTIFVRGTYEKVVQKTS